MPLAMILTHLLNCPVCGEQFTRVDNSLVCAQAHTFDIAREGYVNLLRKKISGDSKEMLTARRAFLEQGHYLPLADKLNDLIQRYLEKKHGSQRAEMLRMLDAGCGEGYYLGHVMNAMRNARLAEQLECVGLDASKDAARMAAKRYVDCCFLVANLKERLVIQSASMDVLLNIFAPRNVEEFARVLLPGGLLVIVIPGPAHLLQLRQHLPLLQIEASKQQHVVAQFAEHFTLLSTTPLRYTLHLRGVEIFQLVMMTPNFWHLSDDTRRSIEHLATLQTEVDFICLLWVRKG